jgi:hypothetical protein
MPPHCRPPELEAEHALGQHGQDDEAPGDHRLRERQRRQRERADVKHPAHDGDRPADRPPPGSKQLGGAAYRRTQAHRGRGDGAAMLPQEREVRGDGRRHREHQA